MKMTSLRLGNSIFRSCFLTLPRCTEFHSYYYIYDHAFNIISNKEFKQITPAGATMAAMTEKVWGEYVLWPVKFSTKMKDTSAVEFKIFFQFSFSRPNSFIQRTMAVILLPRTKRFFLSESECRKLCT